MTVTDLAVTAKPVACSACGTAVAASLLSCPGCHRLVHTEALKAYASHADAATRAGNHQEALAAWRASLELLPPESRQHTVISERIAALSEAVGSASQMPADAHTRPGWKWLALLGPAALVVWKFKFLIVAVLSKGKLLLLGLTKMSTLASMLLAVGVYWTQWGLWFALGLVVSIYIHEMGHVAALRQYGIAASAPMFIPGLGALVRLKQMPANAREDARVGLAGPLWGLGASFAALAASAATGNGLWAAIAATSAWLNLFNLMPVWQLDGSRAFASLTTGHRWLAVAALAAAWMIAGDGMVILVLLVAIARAFTGGAGVSSDHVALGQYASIAIALAGIFRISRTLV
jgi:Zn-dependent protease